MKNLSGVIRDTVPISQFNKGLAGKIFDDVKVNGTKIVMKNNVAECVLMSPEEYLRLMDRMEDLKLEHLALERLKNMDGSTTVSHEQLLKGLGINENDLGDADDIDIE